MEKYPSVAVADVAFAPPWEPSNADNRILTDRILFVERVSLNLTQAQIASCEECRAGAG